MLYIQGWVGLATISGLRVNKDDVVWPDTATNLNGTDPIRFITKSSADTYMVRLLNKSEY